MPDKIMPESFTRQDRDTIIRLDTKFDILIGDVRELKDNVVGRVGKLELDRANKTDLEAIRKQAEQLALSKANHTDIVALDCRIEALENWRSWTIGVGVCIGVVAALIVYIYFSDINTIKTSLEKHIEQSQ
jgi:hypothetical protein